MKGHFDYGLFSITFASHGAAGDKSAFKVVRYPVFLRLTNLEIHAARLFAFLIC